MMSNDKSMTNAKDAPPLIFIHSSFRTGSTYIRSCFRRDPKALTFQEIFSEILAGIRQDSITGFHSENWHSKHPLAAPYFLEFHSMISPEKAGVTGYVESMAYSNFFPRNGVLTDAEVNYVGALIEYARKHDRVPVITANRSLGRIEALKKAFGGRHFLLYRNIFHQWCSYTEQWFRGNPGFIRSVWLALKGEHNEAVTASIARVFSTDDYSALNQNNFFAFVLLHIYLYAIASDVADYIIDMNALSTCHVSRKKLENMIHDYAGLEIDFSDARQTMTFSLVDIGRKESLAETINAFPEIFAPAKSSEGKIFMKKVFDDLLLEYGNYFHYANELVKISQEPLEKTIRLEREVKNLTRKIESISGSPARFLKAYFGYKRGKNKC